MWSVAPPLPLMNCTALRAALVAASLPVGFALAQNTGCVFDPNVDSYIEVPYSAQIVPQSGITVEAWFTYDETAVPTGWRWPTIVRQGIGAGGENIMLRMNCGQNAATNRVLRWRVRTSNMQNLTVDYNFTVGEFLAWTHVAATYDGATLALYINGNLVASTPGNGLPIVAVNDVLRIGKGSDVATPIEVFAGELDEVRLWPFARSQEDIQQSMNLELSSVPGYVSTWNLNNSLADSSGGQNAVGGGALTYSNNPLQLQPLPLLFGLPQGAGTPGCNGDIMLTTSGPSFTSYNDFRVVATRLQPNAGCFWGLSTGTLPAGLPLLGIDVWVDPIGLLLFGDAASPLGTAGLNVPLPANVAGVSFAAQLLAFDTCTAQGFAASDALIVVVQ